MKRKLHLDDLSVDSFATTPSSAEARGSVAGHDSVASGQASCLGTCYDPTCGLSCGGTCWTPATCDHTCNCEEG